MGFLAYLCGSCQEGPDQPVDRPGAMKLRYSYFNYFWPKSDKYRITEHPNDYHRYGIEGLYRDKWVACQIYDPGFDQWGKLQAGRWRELRKTAVWSLGDVRQLRNHLLGISDTKNVIEGE